MTTVRGYYDTHRPHQAYRVDVSEPEGPRVLANVWVNRISVMIHIWSGTEAETVSYERKYDPLSGADRTLIEGDPANWTHVSDRFGIAWGLPASPLVDLLPEVVRRVRVARGERPGDALISEVSTRASITPEHLRGLTPSPPFMRAI